MEQLSSKFLGRKSATRLPAIYRQRSPKNTTFYQVVQEHFPNFLSKIQSADVDHTIKLADHVEAEFDAYLKCGILEHGFVKMSCEECKSTLLVPLSCKKRGFCPSCIGKRMNEGAVFL
jgi:hypothetical protein